MPGVVALAPGDSEWDEVAKLVEQRSKPWTNHYRFSVKLKKLWRLGNSEELAKHEEKAAHLGKSTQLFHGTCLNSAMNISRTGFKLPKKNGMFGSGIYFADCPLKSANFTPDVSCGSVARIWNDGLFDAFQKREGHLILCDVYLGRSKTLRKAANNFNATEDLKPGWLEQTFQDLGLATQGDYNSVYVPGGWFGAVNVDEYVVYQEHQGVPKYLIEFEYAR